MQEVSCRPRDKRGPGCCPCESAGPRPFAAGPFPPTSFCSSLQDASAPRAQGGFLALMCPVLIQGLALPLLSLTCVSRSCADRGRMLVSTKRRPALQPLLGTGDVRAGDSRTVSTELRALRPGPASRGRGGADPASFPWSRCTRRARMRPHRQRLTAHAQSANAASPPPRPALSRVPPLRLAGRNLPVAGWGRHAWPQAHRSASAPQGTFRGRQDAQEASPWNRGVGPLLPRLGQRDVSGLRVHCTRLGKGLAPCTPPGWCQPPSWLSAGPNYPSPRPPRSPATSAPGHLSHELGCP